MNAEHVKALDLDAKLLESAKALRAAIELAETQELKGYLFGVHTSITQLLHRV